MRAWQETAYMKISSKLAAMAAILCVGLFSACEKLIYINGNPGPDPVMGLESSFLHVPAEDDSAISIKIYI